MDNCCSRIDLSFQLCSVPIYMFALSLGAYIVFCIIYRCHHQTLPFGKNKPHAPEA